MDLVLASVDAVFPAGTTVDAYLLSAFPAGWKTGDGVPGGAVSRGASVVGADGGLTITGLVESTTYRLAGIVGSETRFVSVRTDAAASAGSGADGPQGPQGVQGTQGPQGVQGAGTQGVQGAPGAVGAAGLNWRGLWSSGSSYVADDAVSVGGESYFCIVDVGPGGSSPVSDATHWALLSAQGATGPQGVQGATGSQGSQGVQGAAASVTSVGAPWAASTAYLTGDFRSYQGSFYIANQDHTSTTSFQSSKWTRIAGDNRLNVQDFGAGGGGTTNNTLAIRNAIAAAVALAASSSRIAAVVYFPRGTYVCDYISHSLLTAPVTIPSSGSYTLTVANASDAGFAPGNTLTLTDPQLDNSVALQTTVRNITVSSVVGNVVTCTGGSVTGGVFPVGAMVGKQGVDEGQIIFDLTGANNVVIEIDADAVLDMTRAVAYDQGNLGSGYGPILFSTDTDPTTAQYALQVSSPQGGQWVDVGAATQPNPVDGSGSGNTFVDDTWALLASNRFSGFERFNWVGEMVRIAEASAHASWVASAVGSGDTSITLYTPLDNRPFADPNNTATTLNGGINSSVTLAPVANARAFALSSGFAKIDSEIVYYWTISDTTIGLLRAQLGTSAASHLTAASVAALEVVRIESEMLTYTDINTSGVLSGCVRGVNGTSAASHALNLPVVPVAPPGRVYFRTPQQGGSYYVGPPDLRTTVANAVGSGDTTIDGVDFQGFDYLGTVQIDSEQIAYQYRSHGRLHGCTRGINGTAAATHTTTTTIKQVATAQTTLVSGLASSSDVSAITVADASAFRRSGINYIRVDSEVIQVKSGVTSVSKTLNGAIDASQATITLNTVTSLPASGVIEVGQEQISYAAISGSDLTGCVRGVNGTTPATHTSGSSAKAYTGFTLVGTAGNCRGQRGTTAASHTAGATVTEVDAAFLQPITMTENLHIRGRGMIKGQKTTYPRVLYTASLGSGAGGKQQAITLGFAHNVSVQGISIFHTERGGVTLKSVVDGTIDDVRVEGTNRQGYGNATEFLNACANVSVLNSRFRNIRHGGIVSSAGNGDWGVPRRTIFAYNTVEDCINAGWESQNSGQDCLVESNAFLSSPGVAVAVSNDRTIVRNNLIRSSFSDGIQIANLTNRPTHCVVEGNTIDAVSGRGICVQNESGLVSYGAMITDAVIVHNNIIRAAQGQGIVALTSSPVAAYRLRNVSIRGNTISGGATSSASAGTKARIALQSVDQCSVTDNQIVDVTIAKEAIYLSDVTDSLVLGNHARYRTLGTATGILVVSSTAGATANNTFANNRVSNTALGLSLDNNCQNNKVRWNDFAGCTVTTPTMGSGTGNLLDAAGGAVSAHASQHQLGGSDPIVVPVYGSGAGRVQTVPRLGLASAGQTTTQGTEYLAFFTADQDLLVSQLEFLIGTVFGNALDSVQLGLYTLANADTGSVAATLVARTAVTAGANAWAVGHKALALDTAGGFPSTYQLARATRYAMGVVAPVNTGNVGKLCMATAQNPSGVAPYLGSRGGTGKTALDTTPTMGLNNVAVVPYLAAVA